MKNITDVSAFTSPVQVAEDNVDPRTAASVEVSVQALANRTKYLNDQKLKGPAVATTAKRIAVWKDTTGKELEQETPYVDGDNLVVPSGGRVRAEGGFEIDGGTFRDIPLGPGRMKATLSATTLYYDSAGDGFVVEIQAANYGEAVLELDDVLLPGMTLVSCKIGCKPSAARATAAERTTVELYRKLITSTTHTSLTPIWTNTSDATSSAQEITITGAAHAYDPLYRYYVRVRAGLSSNDQFGGALLTVTQTQVW